MPRYPAKITTSAQLAAQLTDETGSGAAVFGTAPQISTIELGNASDTTLSRSGAGVLAVEGVKVLQTNSVSGTASGMLAVNSSSGAIVTGMTNASGTSTSGTPGTNLATITAAGGNQFVNIDGVSGQASAAGTQILCTITYSDATTTTDTTAASSTQQQFVNSAAICRTASGVVANSAKKITAIAFVTAGVGTGTRFATVSAQEIPQ